MKWDVQASILSRRAAIAARLLHWSIHSAEAGLRARKVDHTQDSCKKKMAKCHLHCRDQPHNLLISDWPPAYRLVTLTTKICFAVKMYSILPRISRSRRSVTTQTMETDTRAFGLTNRVKRQRPAGDNGHGTWEYRHASSGYAIGGGVARPRGVEAQRRQNPCPSATRKRKQRREGTNRSSSA